MKGLRRRLYFIPFDAELHKLPPDKRRLPHEVRAALEAEAPGWMLGGFRQRRQGELRPPKVVMDLKEDLMADADPVGRFLGDCCADDDPDHRISLSEMHKVFLAWCEETGATPWTARAFGSVLTEKGWKKAKRSAWYWVGFTWSEDEFAVAVRALASVSAPPITADPDADDMPPF